LLVVAAALSLSAFYTFFRPDERIARLFRAGAELFLLSFLCGSLSYSGTSLGRPLWDAAFLAWDQALGFDWRYWLTFLDGHPKLNLLLALAYHSMWPQLAMVLVALVTIRDFRRLDVLLLAFGFAAIVTVVIAAYMPALSPLAYLQITAADHPHIELAVPREFEMQALALRSGAMHVIELGNAQGLVTFPSFHTATAVLLLLGFRSVPYVRWLSVVVNALMLVSIPIEGSHYLVDVIAGAAVAWAAWAVAAAVVDAGARARLSSGREQQPQQIPIRSF
jgi:membrane-associated phospholipid phosphatase